MFIFGGRTLGTLGGIACAIVLAIVLGGCATPRSEDAAGVVDRIQRGSADTLPVGGARVCMTYGPRLEDKRCGWDQVQKVQSALEQVMLQQASF
ncbi:MAG TPA: hypothetical protein VJ011_03305 [Steroidobacteraceae bacterium]|nr:hypothetical protein [Steroidobacteraceae bacterium]